MGFYIDDQSLPTADEMARALAYNAETGKLIWVIPVAKNIKAGDEAGTFKGARTSRKTGKTTRYKYIRYNDMEFPAARVAWLLHHGEWPKGNVMLSDGDSANLKAENLSLKAITITVERDGKKVNKMSREAQRHYGYKRYYGISLAEYGDKLVEQSGVCAICGKAETSMSHGKIRPLAVDHDHKTGKVRSLLCFACNSILGQADDDREVLLKAVAYLDKHAEAND